jgi:outer membrane protein OmpA-like peptidoglycan-associated protein
MYAFSQRMNALETYQADAMERPVLRRTLFWALVVSLMLHIGILIWFRLTPLPQFSAATARLVPRTIFNLKKITINEAALDDEDKQAAAPKPDMRPAVQPLSIPDDKPVAEVSQGRMAPSAPVTPDIVKPMTVEKPGPDANDAQTIARIQDSADKVMEQDLNSLKDSLLKDQSPGASPLIKLPDDTGAGQGDAAGMTAASARLDQMLGHGLHPGERPLNMPGGALFEFDSAQLRTDALDQLRKIGMLIKLSPNVTFVIEGYTDSFGDPAYNVQLSQQRADSVRTWLIQNMDIDPSHIQAYGYGATNYVVSPQSVDMHSQASIDQEKLIEQPNRRVEISFKFPKDQ